MRVISGLRKGHKIKSPKGLTTRPTVDKIKESLFNILGNINNKALVLDLFSGSGSIGIEFLSRGAMKSYFVDKSQDSINVIKENLRHTKFTDNSIVLKGDAIKILENLKLQNIKFDYIYLDPPFENNKLLLDAIFVIIENNLLYETGLIIVEHEKNLELTSVSSMLYRVDFRKYGNKALSFFKYKEGGV